MDIMLSQDGAGVGISHTMIGFQQKFKIGFDKKLIKKKKRKKFYQHTSLHSE